MSGSYIIVPRSQAECNQLASIVQANGVRSIDVQYTFRVGQPCIFWVYTSAVHYNQFTSKAWDTTVAMARDTGAPTIKPNELTAILKVLF